MEPVINPFYIYLIECLDKFHAALLLLITCSFTSVIYSIFRYFNEKDNIKTVEGYNYLNSYRRIGLQLDDKIYLVKSKISNIINDLDDILKDKSDKLSRISSLNYNIECCTEALHEYDKNLGIMMEDIDSWKVSLERRKRVCFELFGIFLVLLLIKSVLPDTETGYKILLTTYTTPENLHMSVDASKEYIDWAIKSLLNTITTFK